MTFSSWTMCLKAPANYVVRSMVFSAWKKSLSLVAFLLSAKNIPFATIDGSLSLLDRRKVLSNFKSKPDIKVLLITLGTGAVGHVLPLVSRHRCLCAQLLRSFGSPKSMADIYCTG
jgi:hypothetical protein